MQSQNLYKNIYAQFKTIALAAFIIIFSVPRKSNAQDANKRIVNSLNEIITPIQTISPDSSFFDLNFLKQSLKNRYVVSLGEATHGTKEFFLYKDRLIRFLVSELGYKAIAFESDFSAVQNLDEYINNKTDKINTGHGGFPLTQETRSMLSWLKVYNQGMPIEDRVHIYGLEARGFNNISAQILKSLTTLSPEDKATLSKIQQTKYSVLNKKDIDEVIAMLSRLYTEADKVKNSLFRHYVTLLDQVADNYLNYKFNKRDKFMAANAAWVLENTSSKNLIIWAHNGHVAKSNIFKGTPLGAHLYQKYGSGYFAIATAFNQGEVSVFKTADQQTTLQSIQYPGITSPSAYEYYFNQCKFQDFMINVSALDGNEVLVPFFSRNLTIRMVGGTDEPVNTRLSIIKHFDLIVFFNKTGSISNPK